MNINTSLPGKCHGTHFDRKKRFKSKFVVFFDIREQRSILTKQLVDDLMASGLQTHERGLKSSTYSHQNI